MKEKRKIIKHAPAKKINKAGPKKPVTAFFWYMRCRREQLKEQEPDMTHDKLVTRMAEEWSVLEDEEREKFNKLSQEDKARYEKELKEYENEEKRVATGAPLILSMSETATETKKTINS